VFQYGYCYFAYNNLESQVRWAAQYASRITYDSSTSTPTNNYRDSVRNMVLYGDPAGGTTPVVPGLSASDISVMMQFSRSRPAAVTVTVGRYTVNAVFRSVTFSGKPGVTFPYIGRWDPS